MSYYIFTLLSYSGGYFTLKKININNCLHSNHFKLMNIILKARVYLILYFIII